MSATDASIHRSSQPTNRAEPGTRIPVDSEYWLAHCEGYRVESPGGRVGLVEEVRHLPGRDRAESLAVLAGMRGRRRLIIPVSEVQAIMPYAERLFLKPDASLLGSEAC
jgi:hypothetical protein